MFLDPDPKRAKQQSNRGSSGFFSSQRPIESPRDHRKTTKRKAQPLAELSKSQINEQNPWSDPGITTIRLVKPTPPQPVEHNGNAEKDQKSARKENTKGQSVSLVKPASASNAGLPGFPASNLAKSVSDTDTPANETHKLEQPDTHSLLYTTPIHAQPNTGDRAIPETEWHRRNYSNSSTLKGVEDSVLEQRSARNSTRLSQGTTLRGTPTPTEQELRQRIEADDSIGQTSLHTLHEASPERSTLRVVAPSEDGESIDDPLSSEASASPIIEVFSSPTPSPERRPAVPYRQGSVQLLSAGSPQTVYITRRSSYQQTPTEQRSQEFSPQSESTTNLLTSSPNFVAYNSPTPTRPRSGTYPLRHNYSFESIQSRLQSPTHVRPDTGRSIATASSWASLRPSSSHDTLPPLQVPQKRLRHKTGSLSLNAAENASFTSGHSMDEDIDTLPYPREQFSSHLSTIASESDRTDSRRLSHFSLGSGVLTGDDSSSIPFSGTWPRRRRESAPISSIASDAPATSSEEEAGDMTLGIFREGSAKPQPLQPRAGAVPGERKYEGPLPPLPPIPRSRDNEEHVDRLSELQPSQLREKRSGKSLRQRSNSTPSRSISRHLSQISHSETDRNSGASSLFPTWAKNFYGHGAALMSPSKVSLAAPGTPRRDNNGQSHARNDSQWTERSITSRLGTGYTELPDNRSSLTSSHFLPSIFRPRTRNNLAADGSNSRKSRPSKRSRPSREDSRPDSLQIFSNPLPDSQAGPSDTLPSGHPKFGSLKDTPNEQHRPLPRKYSKQKQWDSMQFPRPMTKDRLSDFGTRLETPPHLERNKRHSYRLSAWRAPSFVESLDTLLHARGNRQILLFALGFVCPLLWMLGAVLPVPVKPASVEEAQEMSVAGSEDDIQAAMMKHEAGDAERRWREERAWRKARWWRGLNRVMSVVGVLVIGAVVS